MNAVILWGGTDGRAVWAEQFDACIGQINPAAASIGERDTELMNRSANERGDGAGGDINRGAISTVGISSIAGGVLRLATPLP